jgi:hypothetical protein
MALYWMAGPAWQAPPQPLKPAASSPWYTSQKKPFQISPSSCTSPSRPLTVLAPKRETRVPSPWQEREAVGSSRSRMNVEAGVLAEVMKDAIRLRPVSDTAMESAVPSFTAAGSSSPPSASMSMP